MRRIFLFTLLVLVPAAVPSADAQGRWRAAAGPWGAAEISAIALAGDAWAATPGGLYRSPDGGMSWARDLSPGSALVRDVRALSVLPDGTMLAGSYGGGVFRQLAGTWRRITSGPAFVQSLAVGGAGEIYAGTTDVLLRSLDGGVTWSSRFVNAKKQTIRSLVAYGSTVLAATSEGIYRSEDQGMTWTIASLGLDDLNALALHRMEDGTLYAGLAPIYGGCALYRSRSEGRLWACIEPDQAPLRVETIASDGAGTVMAGGFRYLARSTDSGNTWTVVSSVHGTVRAAAVDGDVSIAGLTGRGILRSTDGGFTWHPSSTGIASTVFDLISAPDGTLYAATPGGLWVGTAGGTEWRLADRATDAVVSVRSLLRQPDGAVVAATSSGVRRFEPGADAWQLLGPPGDPPVRDLALGPDGSIWTGYYEGVYRYASQRWTAHPIIGPDQAGRDVQTVTVDAAGHVFAGATWDSFVRTSTGEWSMLRGASVPYFDASVFAAGPDGALWAGTRYSGVLVSRDGGGVWSGTGSGLMGSEDVRAITFDRDGRPWIATYGSGTYRFESGEWVPRAAGLEGAMRVLSAHHDASGILWAGTDGGGLFWFDAAASTGATFERPMPDRLTLSHPWPNPSSGQATVRVDLPEPASLAVEVFDLLGRRIASAETGTLAPGHALDIHLPVSEVGTGIYLVRLTDGEGRSAATTLVVRR